MNDDHDLDRRLDDAFASRVAGMQMTPPDVDELINRGQQRNRRVLVGGTLGVLVIGAVGIFVLTGGDESTPSDALFESLPPAEQPASTGVIVQQTTWSCVGPLGNSADGEVAFYESCTPGSWSPYAPTTTVLATGTTPCEFVPLDSAAPYPNATTTSISCHASGESTSAESAVTATTVVVPCTIPGCLFEDGQEITSPYTVQMGDYPMLVAERFCTNVDALVAANQWSGPEEFPFPGVVMVIPAAGCSEEPPPTGTSIPD